MIYVHIVSSILDLSLPGVNVCLFGLDVDSVHLLNEAFGGLHVRADRLRVKV